MSIVILSEKGQVTIPLDIRKKLKISKGDPMTIDTDPTGGIILRLAAVLPIEMYSETRLEEFEKEDTLTVSERRHLKKALDA